MFVKERNLQQIHPTPMSGRFRFFRQRSAFFHSQSTNPEADSFHWLYSYFHSLSEVVENGTNTSRNFSVLNGFVPENARNELLIGAANNRSNFVPRGFAAAKSALSLQRKAACKSKTCTLPSEKSIFSRLRTNAVYQADKSRFQLIPCWIAPTLKELFSFPTRRHSRQAIRLHQ